MKVYVLKKDLYEVVENSYSSSGEKYYFKIDDGYVVEVPGYFIGNIKNDYYINISPSNSFVASKKINRKKGTKYPRKNISYENIAEYFMQEEEYFEKQEYAVYKWTEWEMFGRIPNSRIEIGVMDGKWAYQFDLKSNSISDVKRRVSAKSFSLIKSEINYQNVRLLLKFLELNSSLYGIFKHLAKTTHYLRNKLMIMTKGNTNIVVRKYTDHIYNYSMQKMDEMTEELKNQEKKYSEELEKVFGKNTFNDIKEAFKNMMEQLTIFDESIQNKIKLTPITQKLENMILEKWMGETSTVSMYKLSEDFQLSERKIRECITEIRLYGSIYVHGDHRGYYGGPKVKLADTLLVRRTMNSMERLGKMDKEVLSLFFHKLNEIKEEIRNA